MKPEEAYALAQRNIEVLLERHFPQQTSPYFDRLELTTQLLWIVAMTALEVSQNVVRSISTAACFPRVLYMPVCPKCNAELIKQGVTEEP